MSSKIGVGALIFDKKKRILLMYRTDKSQFYKNCWFIPCGKVEKGENSTEAIVREVEEETSLEVKVIQKIYKKINKRGILQIAYLCSVIKGAAIITEPEKCKKLRYFPLNKLPKNIGKKALEIIESVQKAA